MTDLPYAPCVFVTFLLFLLMAAAGVWCVYLGAIKPEGGDGDIRIVVVGYILGFSGVACMLLIALYAAMKAFAD